MTTGSIAKFAASPRDPSPLVQRLAGHALECLLRSLDLSGHTPTQRGLLLEAMNALDDIEAVIEAANGTNDPYDDSDDAPLPGLGQPPGFSHSLPA
jgi:hypothetical protein